jgi:hypothetical protein
MAHVGQNIFADLGNIQGISRKRLSILTSQPLPDERSRVEFQARISRRFSRFAFPNELHPILRPLQEQIRSKAPKTTSPIGQALERVATFRMEVEASWEKPPFDLTLIMVVRDGFLPSVDDDFVPDSQLLGSLDGRSASQLAQRILDEQGMSAGLVTLWNAFARSLASLMLKDLQVPGPVVSSLSTDVLLEDDLSYARFSRSADIDLDDLSGS